jgi:ATP-dependent 26S proteasome regulatory subunit
MVTTIRNIITTDTLNSLKQQAILMQELVIEPGSTSIVVQNLTQRLSLVMYASLVSSELTQARMQVAIDYATKSKVLQLQTQLDKAVSTSKEAVVTVYNLLGTVIKQIPAIFIVILCVIILAIFYYSFQNATRAMYVLDAQETLEKLHDL